MNITRARSYIKKPLIGIWKTARTLRIKPKFVLMVKNYGHTNEFYLGVRAMSEDNSTTTMFQMLKQSILGLFPGSRVEDYLEEDLQHNLNSIDFSCLSSVTCVADFRQRLDDLTDKKFIQGMEKFIDSMRGRAFQAVFIAENVDRAELEQLKRNYENIYTQISPFSNMQISFSLSSSDSTSQGKSNGTSRGITLNSQNMTLKNVLQQLEKQFKRIEDCESFGMWNFATYFVGESAAEALW